MAHESSRGRVYVASILSNIDRIFYINNILRTHGVTITYDWTSHGKVYTPDELSRIAVLERQGVIDCDVFLMVQPGGGGTHVEFGMAQILDKPIVILEDVCVEQKTFYYLPGVAKFNKLDAAIDEVLRILDAKQ